MLSTDLQPVIICFQETVLKANDDIEFFLNHENYNYKHNTGHRASGSVLILIRNDIPHSKINLNSTPGIVVKTTLDRTINICSL